MPDESKPKARDSPPRIYLDGLPRDERKYASHIQALLYELAGHERNFEAAVALFDRSFVESSRNPWAVNWQYIAARDGAMTIFHFGKTIDSVRMNLRRCQTMLNLADQTALRQVGQLMERSFPFREAIRNATAHSAEFMRDADTTRSHAVQAQFPGNRNARIRVSGSLADRTFLHTVGGKLRSYEISRNSFNQLSGIKQAMYRAFLPVESATLAAAQSNRGHTGSTEPPHTD